MKINFHDAAVLLWLPKGEMPTPNHFHPDNDLKPPSPNPEPWWVLGQALIHSRIVQGDHGKEPWIKVGSVVLTPVQVLNAYEAYKNGTDYYT
jgi:hypothetical protein